jgi:hypothetical protein
MGLDEQAIINTSNDLIPIYIFIYAHVENFNYAGWLTRCW